MQSKPFSYSCLLPIFVSNFSNITNAYFIKHSPINHYSTHTDFHLQYETYVLRCLWTRHSDSSLCGLFVASTAAWCARRVAAKSYLLTNPSLNASIRFSIELSWPWVAAMIQYLTALSVLPFCISHLPRRYRAEGWPAIAASSAWYKNFPISFSTPVKWEFGTLLLHHHHSWERGFLGIMGIGIYDIEARHV